MFFVFCFSGNNAEKRDRGLYQSVASDTLHVEDDSGDELQNDCMDDTDHTSDISYTDSDSSGKSLAYINKFIFEDDLLLVFSGDLVCFVCKSFGSNQFVVKLSILFFKSCSV